MKVSLYYDARFVGVVRDGNKDIALQVHYQGEDLLLRTEPVHASMLSAAMSGMIGLVRLVRGNMNRTKYYYRFDVYPDQTLRRAPELDVFDYNPKTYNYNAVGWRNELNSSGFLAPRGIIPGVQGNFVSDSTETLGVDVPYEFMDLCFRFGSDPVCVLRDFIANACRLHHTPELPRGDGFSSHGRDAEQLIGQYLEMVYGKKG